MKNSRVLSRSIATVLFLLPVVATAATDILSGASPSWATTSSWSLGAIPGTGDNAVLTATGTVDIRGSSLGGATQIQDLTFSAGAAMTLINNSTSTGMLLALNGGRGAGVPLIATTDDFVYTVTGTNATATPQTLGIQLGTSGSINVAGAGTLVMSTVISQSGGSWNITKTGTGRLTLSAANTFSGGVLVSGGILEATTNASLGTGAVVVNGGTLEVNLAGAFYNVPSITVSTGGQIAVRNVTLNNAVALSGGTLATRTGDAGTFAGPVNSTGNSFAVLRSYTTPANSQSINITGVLSGSGNLTINGNDPQTNGANKALILTNTSNTYSGTFHVSNNQILRSAPTATGNALGTSTVDLNGGILQLRADGTTSNGTISYGNNVTVQSTGGTINVDRVVTNSGNTMLLGSLSIGAGSLGFTGGNSYGVRFSGATTLTGAATFSPTTATVLLGGAVGGAFDLNKAGSGTLQLNAVNTYTGQTNVNAGTLALVGSIATSPRINVAAGAIFNVSNAAGGFTLAGTQTLTGTGNVAGVARIGNGGTIQPGDATGTGTLNTEILTFGAGPGDTGNINFINTATPATLRVSATDSLVANGGANSVSINVLGAAPAAGDYMLVDYTGSIGGGGFGAFRLGTLPNRLVANLTDNAANTSIDLHVVGSDFPIWKGALSSEWSSATLGSPKNWVLNSNNSSTTDFIPNDTVIFNDIATGTVIDVSVANVSPSSIKFDNSTKNYTVNGSKAITGSTSLTKTGGGMLTINTTNSFTGAVALNGGIVRVPTIANAGVNSALGAGNGLAFDGGTLEITGVSGASDRAIVLNAGGGTVNNANSQTFSGAITGVGSLTKSGNGTLVLSGANSYDSTTILGGTLKVGAGGATGTLGTNSVSNDGSLVFDRSDAALTVNNFIFGGGSVSIVGAGTVTFGGNASNAYSGITTVSAGTLIAGKAVNTIAIPGDLVIGAAGTFRLTASNQIADGASVTINGGTFGDPANAAPAQNGPIDLIGNLTLNGGSFGSGRNLSGFAIGGLLRLNGGTAVAQRGGIISAGAVEIVAGSVNLDGGSATPANESRLNVGSGGLNMTGAGIVFNAGPSALTAGSVGSIVQLNGDLTTTGTSSFVRLNTIAPTATLDLGAAVRIFNVTGTFDPGSAAAPIAITNGGIDKTGSGTLTITGPQSYSELLTHAGTTTLGTALPNAVIANEGGILNLNANATGSTVTANATTNFGSRQTLAALNVGAAGRAKLASHTGGPANIAPIDTSALTITAGGKLDLTNNVLVVRGGTFATIRNQVASGFNGGSWNGAGINSSTSTNDPLGLTALAVASNVDLGYSAFGNVTGLTGNEILVKTTYYGDNDLSGTVTTDDFSLFLDGFTGAAPASWLNGDYDYDGVVTTDDFSLFLASLTSGAPALSASGPAAGGSSAGAPAAVPEPGSIGLLFAGALGLLSRRRRRLG